VPFYLAGAAVLGAVGGRPGARAGAAAAALALGAAGWLAVATGAQVGVWKDPGTLWTRVIETWPGRIPGAYDHLGAWYASRASRAETPEERTRLWNEAARQFRAALKLAPKNPSAANNLGRALERLGESKEAERLYREAAAQAPGFAIPRMNLARLLATSGRRAEGRRFYDQALATGGWVQPELKAEVEALLGLRKR
jgi:tetratricopeptide (TPR) repeat protein